jgi:hypothetical protein
VQDDEQDAADFKRKQEKARVWIKTQRDGFHKALLHLGKHAGWDLHRRCEFPPICLVALAHRCCCSFVHVLFYKEDAVLDEYYENFMKQLNAFYLQSQSGESELFRWRDWSFAMLIRFSVWYAGNPASDVGK